MFINILTTSLKKNKITKRIFKYILNKSDVLNKIYYIINQRKNIYNWINVVFLLLNIKKKIDLNFKCGFFFQDFEFKYWKYLVYYLNAINRGITIKTEDNKIIAYFGQLKIQFLDKINGIYQLNEIFITESYRTFDYKDKVVFDIGGFIGISALYFALNGAKKVYIYEVNKEAYNILINNISVNNFNNKIFAFNIGVSDDYKEKILNITEIKGSSGFFSEFSKPMNIKEKRKIKLVPFKTVLKENVDILKIDCEGCEFEILNSILNNKFIEKINEGIILEAHYIDEKKNPDYALLLLNQIGFRKIVSKQITKNRIMIKAIK